MDWTGLVDDSLGLDQNSSDYFAGVGSMNQNISFDPFVELENVGPTADWTGVAGTPNIQSSSSNTDSVSTDAQDPETDSVCQTIPRNIVLLTPC